MTDAPDRVRDTPCDGHKSYPGECSGEIRKYLVYMVGDPIWGSPPPFTFRYCAEMADRDRKNGFTVEETE